MLCYGFVKVIQSLSVRQALYAVYHSEVFVRSFFMPIMLEMKLRGFVELGEGDLTLEVVLGLWEWAVNCELDIKLAQKARDTEEGNIKKLGKYLVVGVGHFMTKNRGKQLARVVYNGDSLDIELIVKLGKDCCEMAFVGKGSKV